MSLFAGKVGEVCSGRCAEVVWPSAEENVLVLVKVKASSEHTKQSASPFT